MDQETEDVKTAEETATSTTSAGEQTAQTETQETGKKEEAQTTEAREVPEQNRWAERARKAEKRLAEIEAERAKSTETVDPQSAQVKEQLKKLGFVDQETIEKQRNQDKEDQRVQSEISRLEKDYNGSDGRPKFDRQKAIEFALEHQIGDLEVAYKTMHEKDLINWHIQQAVSKTHGVKTEASNGSGSAEAGTTDADLKEAISKGDQKALRTFLKRFAPK